MCAHTVSRSVSRAASPCPARPCLASAYVSMCAWPKTVCSFTSTAATCLRFWTGTPWPYAYWAVKWSTPTDLLPTSSVCHVTQRCWQHSGDVSIHTNCYVASLSFRESSKTTCDCFPQRMPHEYCLENHFVHCALGVEITEWKLKTKHWTNDIITHTYTYTYMLQPYIYIYMWARYLSRCSDRLRPGRAGIESRWRRDLPPVQNSPGAHPASCKMGTVSFPGVKCGRGVLLTTKPLLVPRSWKSRTIPLPIFWTTPVL